MQSACRRHAGGARRVRRRREGVQQHAVGVQGHVCPPPGHAVGMQAMQVGPPAKGFLRHAVGMQAACRWGAPCPPAQGRHAGGMQVRRAASPAVEGGAGACSRHARGRGMPCPPPADTQAQAGCKDPPRLPTQI